MLINGKEYRTIWLTKNNLTVKIIDQRYLPFEFKIEKINNTIEMATAIKDMHLRGAPLIGAAAGYGMYLASLEAKTISDFNEHINKSAELLKNTRPTAINLKWAIDKQLSVISKENNIENKMKSALNTAKQIADNNVEICLNIGLHGSKIIEEISKKKRGKVVNILTHCNAGALATVDHGTATSPIYQASKKNIPLHVWVDETRPRNQGKLTAWELENNKIPNTIIADNTGGHLMQKGLVDLVIVGTDRTTANGDVANKIGTYLKALAAFDNNIPFYVALPSSTIDWGTEHGDSIPIEERGDEEVLYIEGVVNKEITKVRLFSENATAINYAFDITPAKYITGLITEKGICKPSDLREFFGRLIV